MLDLFKGSSTPITIGITFHIPLLREDTISIKTKIVFQVVATALKKTKIGKREYSVDFLYLFYLLAYFQYVNNQ